jgi:hypothetical protein
MQISGFSGASQSYYSIRQQSEKAAQVLPDAADDGQNGGTSPSAQQGVTPVQFSSTLMLDLLNATEQTGNSAQEAGSSTAAPIGRDGLSHVPTPPADLHVTPDSSGATSVTVSSDEVPGGLNLKGLKASDAANEVIAAVGSNGALSLSDVDRMLGITAPETGAHSPQAVTAAEWNRLTGGSGGPMSASQLTKAIQSYLSTQGTAPP